MRYFSVSPAAYPAVATVPPASDLPHDSGGRLFFGASDAGVGRLFTPQQLTALLESGQVREITASEYRSLCSQFA